MMRRLVLVGAVCFLLGGLGVVGAQTVGVRPDVFVSMPWTWSGVQSFNDGKLVINGLTSGSSTIKAPATGGGTVTLPSGSGTLVLSGASGTVTSVVCGTGLSGGTITTTGTCALDTTNANTWSGIQQINSGDFKLKGASSGTITLNAAAAAGTNTLTLPAGTTDFSGTGGTSQVLKQTSAGGAFTVARLACSDLSDSTSACSTSIGTSGATLPLLNAGNTWSGLQSINDGDLALKGSSSGTTTLKAAATAGSTTVTFPAATDTAAVLGTAQSWTATQTFDTTHKITGLPSPSASADAATKGYVDAQVIAAGSGTVTSVTCGTGLSGGTITTTGTCDLDTAAANTWSGVQQVNSGDLKLKGATSGTITLNAAGTAGTNTLTLPAGTTDFSGTGGASQFVKQGSSGGAFTVARPACSDLSDSTSACSTSIGTSGATLPLLNGSNTWSGVQSITDGDLALKGSSSGTTTLKATAAAGTTTITFPAATDTVALLGTADQTVTGGANVTSQSQSTGNITVDCGSRPLQYITNGGAYTITAPSNDGSCILLSTNNGSAGAITFSGFSVGSSTGDALTTTNGNKFSVFVWRINGTSGYRVAAHQ